MQDDAVKKRVVLITSWCGGELDNACAACKLKFVCIDVDCCDSWQFATWGGALPKAGFRTLHHWQTEMQTRDEYTIRWVASRRHGWIVANTNRNESVNVRSYDPKLASKTQQSRGTFPSRHLPGPVNKLVSLLFISHIAKQKSIIIIIIMTFQAARLGWFKWFPNVLVSGPYFTAMLARLSREISLTKRSNLLVQHYCFKFRNSSA